MSITVSSQFDSGNILFIDGPRAGQLPAEIRLRIRADSRAEFFQWFHFRVSGAAGQALRLVIENAAEASYADGWRGYQCVASYDRQDWFRIPATHYDGKALSIDFTPQRDAVWLAYFEPYSHERHQDLIARCAVQPGVRVEDRKSVV